MSAPSGKDEMNGTFPRGLQRREVCHHKNLGMGSCRVRLALHQRLTKPSSRKKLIEVALKKSWAQLKETGLTPSPKPLPQFQSYILDQ